MDGLKDEVWRRFGGTTTEFDAVWRHLVEEDLVRTSDPSAVEDALYDAEKLLGLLRDAAPEHHPEPLRRGERSAERVIEAEVDEHTRARQEAFSEVAAAMAETDPLVEYFREYELGGRLLSRDEAKRVLWGEEREAVRGPDVSILEDVARELAENLRWTESAAAWFVLTGDAPRVDFLSARVSRKHGRGHYPDTARITLTVDPHVDARDVERLYRKAQRQLLKGDNRKLAGRTLEAARFVAAQFRERGAESWPRRTERWNRQFPQWRYRSRGGLRQAFEKFWHPNYGRGEWKLDEPQDQRALHELLLEEDGSYDRSVFDGA